MGAPLRRRSCAGVPLSNRAGIFAGPRLLRRLRNPRYLALLQPSAHPAATWPDAPLTAMRRFGSAFPLSHGAVRRTAQSVGPRLVLSRALDMIDDQDLHRANRRFQFQPKLLLHSLHKRRSLRIRLDGAIGRRAL